MCGMLTLSSCSTEEVIPFDKLRDRNEVIVSTRGDTDTPLQTRLYIFNEAGRCIQQLSPDEHEQFVTTSLTTGTYCQGGGRHILGSATEEAGVGDAGVCGERLHTGS